MKVAIIGGGISGLSTAYYIKKLGLPVSQILIYESASKFGGWIDSKKISYKDDEAYFEKGPRTLRLATGELKELNSIQMAEDLDMGKSVELVPTTHPAASNRYIYCNNKINVLSTSLFRKNDILPKPLYKYLWKEVRSPRRDSEVKDESIWSFISRRFGPEVADNLIDPVFKGICGGDVKTLSAATLVKSFYEKELSSGSIVRGMFGKKTSEQISLEENYKDLVELRKSYQKQSVWRVRSGMAELIDKLVDRLSKEENVKLFLNEPVSGLEFDKQTESNQIQIKSRNSTENVDVVVSSIYSKQLANLLSDDYKKTKDLLRRIQCVDMAIVNFYFKENVLPINGFGYLVPTKENSPILGCIFDSVFNKPDQNNTVLTTMLGGAWYEKYIGNKNADQIYDMAFKELRSHLKLSVDPDLSEVTVLKEAIPQYKVGHQDLLHDIHQSLNESNLDSRLYLTGNTYDGIGVNDAIFNARKLVENHLAKLCMKSDK